MTGEARANRARRTRAGGAKKRPTRYATDEPSERLRDALRAHRSGDFAEAAPRYRQALAHEGPSVDLAMNFAAVLVQLGRARDARAQYALALGLADDDARVQRDAGIGLAAIGDAAQARACLERALARDATQQGARLVLARVCAELGDRRAAVARAREAVDHDPLDSSSWIELHRACFDDAALAPCLDAIDRACTLDPTNAHALALAAGAHGLAGTRGALDRLAPWPGLRDLVETALAFREDGSRVFSYKRELLIDALTRAPRDGAVLEFGVRHGVSTRLLAAQLTTGRVLEGFDSFAGLPQAWRGLAAGAFSTDGERPDVPLNVRLHVGLFEHTLPAYLRERPPRPAFVHIDSDLYASAATVLEALAPSLGAGSVLVFDELFGNERFREDEHRALHEAVARYGLRYEVLSVSWITGQAALRLR